MKLEENFSLSEFKCRDGSNVPDELMDNVCLLAKNLQVLREHVCLLYTSPSPRD